MYMQSAQLLNSMLVENEINTNVYHKCCLMVALNHSINLHDGNCSAIYANFPYQIMPILFICRLCDGVS